jgi:hypothetical protein
MRRSFMLFCMVSLWLSPSLALSWKTSDLKPGATLKAMDERALAQEAQTACIEIALFHRLQSQYSSEALANRVPGMRSAQDYLGQVGEVAREKHGGTMPAWHTDMENASRETEAKKCLEVRVG